MHSISEWYEKNKSKIQEDYFKFLRFPSISSEPEYKQDVLRCANWALHYLLKSGLHAELIETSGHPIVYAETNPMPGKPTIMIYGHYDVQPVDPVELWKSPPFEPTEREGRIYARGAVDDKGQIFYAMAAVRALREQGVALPINVKFCIEGEEEASSVGLLDALPKIKNRLKAEYLLVVDHDAYDETTPAMNLGCRGQLSMEVILTGSNQDLHSGLLGGIAYNPNRAIAELLAKLYDPNGRVQVPGFYDEVEEPTEEEKKMFLDQKGHSYYTETFGIHAFGGEKGRSPGEANLFRPTLEINGIAGGYGGPGVKTVIPAKAIAKLSCRLVPGQDPDKIVKNITSFLQNHCVHGMKLEVKALSGAFAYRCNPDSKLARALAESSEKVMKKTCRTVLSGASIPVIAILSRAIGAETVGMGYGLPTDLIHAPNEHFDMRRFEQGFLTVGTLLQEFA